ncbi:MAG: MFS transporter [Chloroflexaceae bacterium]|nr:MFS transporter [Chloroflexaceae bacterium]
MPPARLMLLGLFGAYMGFAMLAPVLAPLFRELGLSEFQAGMTASAGAVAWALMGAFWGRRSDAVGRKPVFLIGLAGLGVGFLLFSAIAHLGLVGLLGGGLLFALLFVGRIIGGALFSASPAAAQAYIADVSPPEERTKQMALVGAATGMGFVLGPALSGVLAGFGLLAPLYIGAALPLLAAAFVAWRVPNPPQQNVREAAPRLNPLDGRFWPFLLVGITANLAIIMAQITIGFRIQDRFGFDAQHTAQISGVCFVIAGVTLVATQLLIVRRLGWPPRTLVRLGLPLSAAGYALLLLAPNLPLIFVAFALVAMGLGLNEPGFTAAMTLAVDSTEYGAVSGMTASVIGLASVVGPLLGTGLYELGADWPYLFGVVLFVAASVFVWLNEQVRRAVPAQAPAARA